MASKRRSHLWLPSGRPNLPAATTTTKKPGIQARDVWQVIMAPSREPENPMKCIHCALEGRLGQDVELRRSQSGKDWCRLSVGVGEGDEVTWVTVAVFEEKARALAGLEKGVEVYCEGSLHLNVWTGRDGVERTGLNVTAWQVVPMGQIGRRKLKARPRDEREAVPFNDALTFSKR
jgi:hypothetical protein